VSLLKTSWPRRWGRSGCGWRQAWGCGPCRRRTRRSGWARCGKTAAMSCARGARLRCPASGELEMVVGDGLRAVPGRPAAVRGSLRSVGSLGRPVFSGQRNWSYFMLHAASSGTRHASVQRTSKAWQVNRGWVLAASIAADLDPAAGPARPRRPQGRRAGYPPSLARPRAPSPSRPPARPEGVPGPPIANNIPRA
jgi:hypothetical protein